VKQPLPTILPQMHRLKNNMILRRRSLWPLREVIARLERWESPLTQDATSIYFKDFLTTPLLPSRQWRLIVDILAGLLDLYLSRVSDRLNEIMKVLSIIATIFMPLTFLVGVYGMNFAHMPELKWRYGYYGGWTVIFPVAGCMVLYFKKKEWI